MSDMAIEHEFSMADQTWVVRAYDFPTNEEAKAAWESVHSEWKGNEGDFSIWRTRLSDDSAHLVVLCGRRETLVEVGGKPFPMPYAESGSPVEYWRRTPILRSGAARPAYWRTAVPARFFSMIDSLL